MFANIAIFRRKNPMITFLSKSHKIGQTQRIVSISSRDRFHFNHINQAKNEVVENRKTDWNKIITDAERIIGYQTSVLNPSSVLLANEATINITSHLRKLIQSNHPVVKIFKWIIKMIFILLIVRTEVSFLFFTIGPLITMNVICKNLVSSWC